MKRGAAIFFFLSLVFSATRSDAEPPQKWREPCGQPLWGCPTRPSDTDASSTTPVRYERLLSVAREAAGSMRAGMRGDFDAAIRVLSEATQLFPEAPEAQSLLGQVQLERGQFEAAAPFLHRAEELYAVAMNKLPAQPLELIDPDLCLALGFLSALEGDLPGALERYHRLLRLGAPSHRLLYRTADVLMALGRLEEATTLFERACLSPRSFDTPSNDVPRGCLGYLVALDRGEHMRATRILARMRNLDRDLRSLLYNDFLAPWERKYHQAMMLPLSCERLAALHHYLRGADGKAPRAYVKRAEAHLKATSLPCPSSVE